MQTIEVLETGLIYRNPKPHLQAVHAWHPSVDYFDDWQMVLMIKGTASCGKSSTTQLRYSGRRLRAGGKH